MRTIRASSEASTVHQCDMKSCTTSDAEASPRQLCRWQRAMLIAWLDSIGIDVHLRRNCAACCAHTFSHAADRDDDPLRTLGCG